MRKEPLGQAGLATFFSWTKVNSMSVRLEISSSYLGGERERGSGRERERERGHSATDGRSLGYGYPFWTGAQGLCCPIWCLVHQNWPLPWVDIAPRL